jgi:hypothetical protein
MIGTDFGTYRRSVNAGTTAVPTLVALRRARAHQATTWRWLRLAGPLIIGLQIIVLSRSTPGHWAARRRARHPAGDRRVRRRGS